MKRHGDAFNDGYVSMRNLIHQLHSMDRVAAAALDAGAEVCVFVRPDLRYHDCLQSALDLAWLARTDLVQLPRWQPSTGMNDRFAICKGRTAIEAYGMRIRKAATFCERTGTPLRSERLAEYALDRPGVAVRRIGARASRVRVDGRQRYEDFAHPAVAAIKRTVMPRLSAMTELLGMRRTLKRLAGQA